MGYCPTVGVVAGAVGAGAIAAAVSIPGSDEQGPKRSVKH